MSWYRTGTVSVTNGSAAVTGTGTAWVANLKAGDAFVGPDGKVYEVQSVSSNTGLTLASNYSGATLSGQAYAVSPTQDYLRVLATQVASLLQKYQTADLSLKGDFEAVLDGVADDTAAMLSAIASRRRVRCEPGIARITSKLRYLIGSKLAGDGNYSGIASVDSRTGVFCILYDGPTLPYTDGAVLEISAEDVGVYPTNGSTANMQNVECSNILVDCNEKADIGVYAVRAFSNNNLDFITVTGANLFSHLALLCWNGTVRNWMGYKNPGAGPTIGRNFFGWASATVDESTLIGFMGYYSGWSQTRANYKAAWDAANPGSPLAANYAWVDQFVDEFHGDTPNLEVGYGIGNYGGRALTWIDPQAAQSGGYGILNKPEYGPNRMQGIYSELNGKATRSTRPWDFAFIGASSGGSYNFDVDGAYLGSGSTFDNDTFRIVVGSVNEPNVSCFSRMSVTSSVATALEDIVVSDADSGSLTMTFVADSGAWTAPTSGGVTATIDTINGDPRATLVGSPANLNTYLAAGNLKFTSAGAVNANLTLTVSDGGAAATNAVRTAVLDVDKPSGTPLIYTAAKVLASVNVATAISLTAVADTGPSTLCYVKFATTYGDFTYETASAEFTALHAIYALQQSTADGKTGKQVVLQGTFAEINAYLAAGRLTWKSWYNDTNDTTVTIDVFDGTGPAIRLSGVEPGRVEFGPFFRKLHNNVSIVADWDNYRLVDPNRYNTHWSMPRLDSTGSPVVAPSINVRTPHFPSMFRESFNGFTGLNTIGSAHFDGSLNAQPNGLKIYNAEGAVRRIEFVSTGKWKVWLSEKFTSSTQYTAHVSGHGDCTVGVQDYAIEKENAADPSGYGTFVVTNKVGGAYSNTSARFSLTVTGAKFA